MEQSRAIGHSKATSPKAKISARQKRKLTCLDLFCGCGGLSRGFIDAGFKCVLGVDFDDAALKTFKENHDGATAMKLDLFDHGNIDAITNFLKKEKIALDVLIGGPPCQGFSVAGPRNRNDKRNFLYEAMVKLTARAKPRAVLLENVPGLVEVNDGIGAKRIVEDFAEIGYDIQYKLLYAPEFGVPQIRRRVFFIGLRNGVGKFEFPKPRLSKGEFLTCEEAIGDLPGLDGIVGDAVQEYPMSPQNEFQRRMRKRSTKIHNHEGTIHERKTVEWISMVPEGKNYRALPPEIASRFKYHEALTRYHSKKPSLTINTGHRSHFHYKWNRIPTVRESARLQTFPDDFVFYGTKGQQYRQVGNAVPPMLGKAVALQLKKCLEKA